MKPLGRRATALVAVAALVAGLAACAPAEPEAQPEPTVTPTPTPTSTGSALGTPTPRVPAGCGDLFDSAVLSGRVMSEAERASALTPFSGASVQAGVLGCEFEGEVAGAAATVYLSVTVDTPPDSIWWYAGWGFDEEDFFTAVAGEASHLGCQARPDGAVCQAELVSAGYGASLDIRFDEPDVDVTQAVIEYLNDLDAVFASLPEARPAWQPPAGVLTWSDDCEGVVREQQDVVRSAVPFPLGDAVSNLGPDGTWAYYEIFRVTRSTECGWTSNGSGIGGGVDLSIVPGGAWMHEAGVPLGGEPYSLPGARAAAVEIQDGQYQLSAYIDGSYVSVRVSAPFDSGIDLEPIARDIVAALVAAF